MRRAIAATAVCSMVASGCAGWSGTHEPDQAESIIVSSERIPAPGDARAWTVEYRSMSIAGEPITVTGWIAVPEVQGTIPVLVWAHETVGMGDECAPSRTGDHTPFDFSHELGNGWAVVATDYEGLGSPGPHPYLVAESAARSLFDIARAARELDRRVGTDLVLWGADQGGHAVLSAAALASRLAPEFRIAGVAAVAPLVDLTAWVADSLGQGDEAAVLRLVIGYVSAYDLDPATILTPQGIDLLGVVEDACSDGAGSGYVAASPVITQPWSGLLVDNSPETLPMTAPILLIVGDQDRSRTLDSLTTVTNRMCAAGTPLATTILLGQDHDSVNGAARGDIDLFLADRLAGVPFTSEC